MTGLTADLRALMQRAMDGDLSADEFQQLEQRLQTDPALRAEYVKFVDLEACLHDELQARPEPAVIPVATRSPRSWRVLAAAAVACLLVIAVLWDGKRNDPGVAQHPEEQRANVPRVAYLTAPLQGLPDVAVVTAMDQPVVVTDDEIEGGAQVKVGALTLSRTPGKPQVGMRLKPGVLTLSGGELQLDFLGGSRLLVRGPAELHLVSGTAATLVSGTAAVRVPFSPAGFTLNAPDAAVISMAAEFSAQVQPDGRTLVQVEQGLTDISILGEDGSTLISQRLTDRSAVLVDAAKWMFIPQNQLLDDLPRVRDLHQTQLVVTEDYVREVEQSKPYLFWRFESEENGLIPDALGGPYAAKILCDEQSRDAVRIANGAAEFLPSFTPRCIASADVVREFNTTDFTIELWVMPTELKASAIFSTVLPEEGLTPKHLNFLEIAYNTNLVHKPGVIRFLHRQPPSRTGGYNLFTQEICTPGAWSHIVATKSADELRLYSNGQLMRSVSGPGTGASDDFDYRLVLGQLGTLNNERQFHGLIDEVAVYDRVLRPDEISRHYWSIVRGVPLASRRPAYNEDVLIGWRGR